MQHCATTTNVHDDGSRHAPDHDDSPVAAGTARACCPCPPLHREPNAQARSALPLIVQDGDLKQQPRRFGHDTQSDCVPSVLPAEHDRVRRRGRETRECACRARGGGRGSARSRCERPGVWVPDVEAHRHKPERCRRTAQPDRSLSCRDTRLAFDVAGVPGQTLRRVRQNITTFWGQATRRSRFAKGARRASRVQMLGKHRRPPGGSLANLMPR